jgi:hypothetical protein
MELDSSINIHHYHYVYCIFASSKYLVSISTINFFKFLIALTFAKALKYENGFLKYNYQIISKAYFTGIVF